MEELTVERQQMVEGLRELAAFLESRPEVPQPLDIKFNVWVDGDLGKIAPFLGSFQKEGSDYYFELIKSFGPIEVSWFKDRQSVCVRKVVGTRMVPEKYVPGELIEAHEEEIVEWECPESLLAPAPEPTL